MWSMPRYEPPLCCFYFLPFPFDLSHFDSVVVEINFYSSLFCLYCVFIFFPFVCWAFPKSQAPRHFIDHWFFHFILNDLAPLFCYELYFLKKRDLTRIPAWHLILYIIFWVFFFCVYCVFICVIMTFKASHAKNRIFLELDPFHGMEYASIPPHNHNHTHLFLKPKNQGGYALLLSLSSSLLGWRCDWQRGVGWVFW